MFLFQTLIVCFLSIACKVYSTRKPVRNSFDDLLPAEPRHGFCAGTVQRHLLEKSANVKDQFFVYKSCLKHAKNKIFDNFCDWMQKSKLLVLCLKAVFGCPKPAFWVHKTCKNKFLALLSCFCESKIRFCTPKR